MSMDGSFVHAIRDIIEKPQAIKLDGKEILLHPHGWSQVRPPIPTPAPLLLSTLTGLRDYLSANVDAQDLSTLMLHVANSSTVRLVNEIGDEEDEFRRECYAIATAETPDFAFDKYLESEWFFVRLQTCFKPSEDREKLLILAASIKDHAVSEFIDDTISQTVNTARGIKLERTPVPNPVRLSPFRTFQDDGITQPESLFVLRMQSGKEGGKPTIALFEADGGAWKLDAINQIATWLRANTKGVAVIG